MVHSANLGIGPDWFKISLCLLLVPPFCAVLNLAVDRVVYKPLRTAPNSPRSCRAIGVSFVFMNVGLFWGGPQDANFPNLLPTENILDKEVFGGGSEPAKIVLTWKTVLVLAVTIPLMIALTLFVKFTPLGKAMRATAQNPTAARLMGINTDRVIGATFLIGGAWPASAASSTASRSTPISYQMGFQNGLYAFTAAVLGGIGNIPGAVLGGLVIGLVRSFGSAYIGETWTAALVFVMLIVVLVFRPSGLARRPRAGESMNAIPRWPLAIFIILLLFPLFPSLDAGFEARTGRSLGEQMPGLFIFAILALALNVVVGYTGLLHLGIAAFFGIGAYVTGILTVPAYPVRDRLLARRCRRRRSWPRPSAACSASPRSGSAATTSRSSRSASAKWSSSPSRTSSDITAGTRGLNPVPPPSVPSVPSELWAVELSARSTTSLSRSSRSSISCCGTWNDRSSAGPGWPSAKTNSPPPAWG